MTPALFDPEPLGPRWENGKLIHWRIAEWETVPASWFEANQIELDPDEPYFRSAQDRFIFLDHVAHRPLFVNDIVMRMRETIENKLLLDQIERSMMPTFRVFQEAEKKRAGFVPALLRKIKSWWIRTRSRT